MQIKSPNFDLFFADVHLPNSCIYFLLYKRKIMYIGRTINILKRVQQHQNKQFDTVYTLPISSDASLIENAFIDYFKPPYNLTIHHSLGYSQKVLKIARARGFDIKPIFLPIEKFDFKPFKYVKRYSQTWPEIIQGKTNSCYLQSQLLKANSLQKFF